MHEVRIRSIIANLIDEQIKNPLMSKFLPTQYHCNCIFYAGQLLLKFIFFGAGPIQNCSVMRIFLLDGTNSKIKIYTADCSCYIINTNL